MATSFAVNWGSKLCHPADAPLSVVVINAGFAAQPSVGPVGVQPVCEFQWKRRRWGGKEESQGVHRGWSWQNIFFFFCTHFSSFFYFVPFWANLLWNGQLMIGKIPVLVISRQAATARREREQNKFSVACVRSQDWQGPYMYIVVLIHGLFKIYLKGAPFFNLICDFEPKYIEYTWQMWFGGSWCCLEKNYIATLCYCRNENYMWHKLLLCLGSWRFLYFYPKNLQHLSIYNF